MAAFSLHSTNSSPLHLSSHALHRKMFYKKNRLTECGIIIPTGSVLSLLFALFFKPVCHYFQEQCYLCAQPEVSMSQSTPSFSLIQFAPLKLVLSLAIWYNMESTDRGARLHACSLFLDGSGHSCQVDKCSDRGENLKLC